MRSTINKVSIKNVRVFSRWAEPQLFAKAEGKAATTWHGRHGSSTQDAPRGQSRRCGRREHRATSADEEPHDHGGAAAAQVVVVQGAARALGLQTAPRRGRDAPKPRRAGERGKGGEGTTRAAAQWLRREGNGMKWMGFQGFSCSMI